MRWNSTIVLRDVDSLMTVDDEGNEIEGGPVDTEVFCNVMRAGQTYWATAAAIGNKPEAQVQVRALDYTGQTQAVFEGTEMDVEASRSGEYTVLTLSRHARIEEAADI